MYITKACARVERAASFCVMCVYFFVCFFSLQTTVLAECAVGIYSGSSIIVRSLDLPGVRPFDRCTKLSVAKAA